MESRYRAYFSVLFCHYVTWSTYTILLACDRNQLLQLSGRVFNCKSSDLDSIPSWDRYDYFHSTKMAPTLNNIPYVRSVHKNSPLVSIHAIPVPRNLKTTSNLKGVCHRVFIGV